ncbi:MAG TPA: hypothetical protein VJW17_06635 [Pyrinomonadaceae bacterium]|nr:hypothetical protein [Pyrinomonadaceae bacterium]
MVLRIFEEPTDEPTQPVDVSIAVRLAGCAVAWLVAFMPAITAGSSTLQLVRFFRSITPETASSKTAIMSALSNLNVPVIIGLCVSALLAFAFAITLAMKPRFRLASVGLPCSVGVLMMAAAPALLLWTAETDIVDVLNLTTRSSSAEVASTAKTVSELMFAALGLSILTIPASFIAPLVTLLVSPQSRTEPFSQRRVMVWLCGAVLLLVLAGAYLIVV